MLKTIRFADLVENSGRPHVHTIWSKQPRHDKGFTDAVKRNRVLTVVQDPTHKRKDYGEVGFHQRHGATHLVFPRELPETGGARVVGINYELLAAGG